MRAHSVLHSGKPNEIVSTPDEWLSLMKLGAGNERSHNLKAALRELIKATRPKGNFTITHWWQGSPQLFCGQWDLGLLIALKDRVIFTLTSRLEGVVAMVGLVRTFYEFFSGGGLARYGLGPQWRCLLANDIDEKKAACYRANFGSEELIVADVASLETSHLAGTADLAWASFPCQDLSLAGNGAGLRGHRSGTFWPFWRLVKGLCEEGRAPRLVVLENVCGTLRSHGGRDFVAIGEALASSGYRFGALVVDAVGFLPQSRPRLFMVGTLDGLAIPEMIASTVSDLKWTTQALVEARRGLSKETVKRWVWWTLPEPRIAPLRFSDLIEEAPTGVEWHSPQETQRLLSLMSNLNRAKVNAKKRESKLIGRRVVGTIYKRTREDENGDKRQRAEVRFDEIAGCLRTPAGGSSRQTIVVIEGDQVRSRLLSAREAARLMGLLDDYKLPSRYNEAYHVAGDGLAIPVVRHLAEHLLEPLLDANDQATRAA